MTASKTITSFIWSFLEQGGSKAVALIVQVVLARILDPSAFGVLAILLVVTNVADSIAQSGLGLALIQKSNADEKAFNTGFCLSMLLALVMYAAIYTAAPVVSSFYGMPELTVTLRVLGVVVFFNSANSLQRAWLQRSMEFKGIFRVSLSAVCASGVVGVVAAFLGLGIWALVIQAIVQSAVTCVAMRAVVPWRPRFTIDRLCAKELYAYGWKVCVVGILNVFYTGVSELILGRACTAAELGYYSQGRKYPGAAIAVFTNAIANVLFPMFSAMRDDARRFARALKRAMKMGSFLLAPVSVLCAVVAEPLVALLLTEKWLPCVLIFQLTCISNLFTLPQLVNLRGYMALGMSGLYARLQIAKVAAGIVIIGGAAFATHDIYATAWATFFVGMFNVIVVDMQPARKMLAYGRMEQLRDLAPAFLLSAVSAVPAGAVSLFGLPYVAELLMQVVAYSATYLLFAKIFRMEALDDVTSQVKAVIGQTRVSE